MSQQQQAPADLSHGGFSVQREIRRLEAMSPQARRSYADTVISGLSRLDVEAITGTGGAVAMESRLAGYSEVIDGVLVPVIARNFLTDYTPADVVKEPVEAHEMFATLRHSRRDRLATLRLDTQLAKCFERSVRSTIERDFSAEGFDQLATALHQLIGTRKALGSTTLRDIERTRNDALALYFRDLFLAGGTFQTNFASVVSEFARQGHRHASAERFLEYVVNSASATRRLANRRDTSSNAIVRDLQKPGNANGGVAAPLDRKKFESKDSAVDFRHRYDADGHRITGYGESAQPSGQEQLANGSPSLDDLGNDGARGRACPAFYTSVPSEIVARLGLPPHDTEGDIRVTDAIWVFIGRTYVEAGLHDARVAREAEASAKAAYFDMTGQQFSPAELARTASLPF